MTTPFQDIAQPRPTRLALFAYGFRPFFLAAGLYAIGVVMLWLMVLHTGRWPDGLGSPMAWHGHEMLFGFAGAAIAGFLLTAVPNWTGERGFAGGKLIALTLLWLAGRVALNPIAPLPALPAAMIDLTFFPALGAMVLPSIIRARNRRNYVMLLMLGLLTLASSLYHAERLGWLAGGWAWGQALAIDMVLLMVALIGGRIVPSFTSSALKRLGRLAVVPPFGLLDRAALISLALLTLADLVQPQGWLPGVTALLAGIAHALRLARWQGVKALDQPILWSLHLAYAWIPLGLLLKAGWLLGGLAIGQTWVHALTAGAFSGMILAVMSRAALGHTGREIVAAKPTVAAYILLTLAALVRVLAPVLPDMGMAYSVAGLCWVAAFILYSLAYAPILITRRADGRPG
ncbi:NnrS family protein [Niveispirillum sp. BGYR6]|uniref:NnrS family protein n=1 Tax=Niveispirillum sp. BGYR6 TaxID=2971249 RepID=UPI0022B9611E|nr:NnrS family protein [Niveispirillum sp. BGYR6]MDG5497435.1 NnrS family protein [Niveispirillum sp. BGYR6]